MLNRSIFIRLAPIVALTALMLAGCNKTPSETSKDVSQAREEAAEDVSEARQDANRTENKVEEKVVDAQQDYAKTDANARAKLNEVQSEGHSKTAKADFDVAIAKAKGIEDVAKQKCGVLGGAEKNACLSTAAATYEASKADATAKRDAALVAATQ